MKNTKILSIMAVMLLAVIANKADAQSKMYWTDYDNQKIQCANLDGNNVEDVSTGISGPYGIALDTDAGSIYWTNYYDQKIQRSGMDGNSLEDVITGLTAPYGIALDVGAGKIYWTDNYDILRASTDGNDLEYLIVGLGGPKGIALDTAAGKIYLTDSSAGKVQRANLDGTGLEDLVTGLGDLYGIALDISFGKMYWVATGNGKIQRANLDGTGAEDLVTGLTEPGGIALDISSSRMYWTDVSDGKIQRANLDGTGTEDLVTGLNEPIDIAIYPETPTDAEAFSYQGKLYDGNTPADGPYDFQFQLFDDSASGTQVGMTSLDDIYVNNGYFTAELQFPEDSNVFNGEPRWLEIAVRWGEEDDPGAFVTLSPRQKIMPTPYAMHAALASNAEAAESAQLAKKVGFAAVDTNGLTAGAVTNSALASNAVDSNNLNTGAVTSAKIQDGTIVNADISATASISASKINTTALDADTVDGSHAADFAASGHEHDAAYVNEGQTDSITSSMVTDGTIVNADISGTASISASKINSTGLDADSLDGQDSSAFASSSHDHDSRYYTETELQSSGSSSVHWANLTNRPAGLDDGDDVGITSEEDPTVLTSVKDGIDWSEVSSRPAGLDDGDDVGITSEEDPTVLASVKDGIDWSEVSSRPAGLDDGDDVGITSETDPTVLASVKDGIDWSELSNIPADINDGDDQLNESEVDAFVANNGYINNWADIPNVPAGFADGVDNLGYPTDSNSLFAFDYSQEQIVQFDPATGNEIFRFDAPAGDGPPSDASLAFDGTSIFFIRQNGQTLWRINAGTGKVIDRYSINFGVGNIRGLAVLNDKVYLCADPNIYELDPASGIMTNHLDLSTIGPLSGLAGIMNPDRLIVVTDANGQVYEVHPGSGVITGSFNASDTNYPSAVAVAAGLIYVAEYGSWEIDVYSRDGAVQNTLSLSFDVVGLGGDQTQPVPSRIIGELFVVDDSLEDIVQIDPATAQEIFRFDAPAGGGPLHGASLAFDGASIFLVKQSDQTLWRINAGTGQVIDQYSVDFVPGNIEGLAVLNGKVYLCDNSDIYEIDPASGVMTNQIYISGISSSISGLAGIMNPNRLIVTTDSDDHIYEVHPGSGQVTGSFIIDGMGSSTRGVAVAGGLLYVTTDSFQQIDVYSRSGALLTTLNLTYDAAGLGGDQAQPVPLRSTDELFTIDQSQRDIVEIDPVTGQEVSRFDAPGDPFAEASLAFDGTSIFFVTDNNNTLWRLNPASGQVIDQYNVSFVAGNARGLAALNGQVYLCDNSDIYEFDPESGTMTNHTSASGISSLSGLAGIMNPNRLIVTADSDNRIYEVHPGSGQVTNSFTIDGGSNRGAAVAGGLIYVTTNSSQEIDVYSRSGALLTTLNLPYNLVGLGGDQTDTSAMGFTGWQLRGNEDLADGINNFIGTKDPVGLNVMTNNNTAMRVESDGKIGIGTTNPAYDLDVNGDIRAVGSVFYGGTEGNPDGTAYTKPDYVFQKGYVLMTIEQVEEYLNAKNHLPWMTSAKQETQENGDVIDMTRMAFETVETAENLQMQIILLNKKNKELEKTIAELEKMISQMQHNNAKEPSYETNQQ